jgi:methyl-accepting chemotaxis protein
MVAQISGLDPLFLKNLAIAVFTGLGALAALTAVITQLVNTFRPRSTVTVDINDPHVRRSELAKLANDIAQLRDKELTKLNRDIESLRIGVQDVLNKSEERTIALHARLDPIAVNTAEIKGRMEAFTDAFRTFNAHLEARHGRQS